MTPDIILAVTPVIEAFEKLAIRYYIGGSLASSAHGVIRATSDVDLIADLDSNHVAPLSEMLGKEYYLNANTIADAIKRRACFNLIHLGTMFKVDVFASKSTLYGQAAFERTLTRTLLEDTPKLFFVASPEDTILSKLEGYRLGDEISERQWTDILGVMKAQAENLDRAYLEKWAAELRVADLLEKASKEAK
jgi:hypothetical protein